MAPEHSGFIEEYPLIRVDKFTGKLFKLPNWINDSAKEDLPSQSTHFSPPHIQLLSHPHTDHLVGLSSLSQHCAPIYCSELTKRLLLALERKEDRIRFDEGKCSFRKRPYRHLQRTGKECQIINEQIGIQALKPWDLLIPLPYDQPIRIQYNASFSIRLTLLPANHMPGSTMFLIEGPRGTVLHTGDLRAEQNFLQDLIAKTNLSRLSILPSPILTSSVERFDTPSIGSDYQLSISTLESIYLDTERIMDSQEPTLRSKAINDVLQIIKLYPQTTRFHIDLWTSGYEQFCVGLSKAFAIEKETGLIHIDRYKAELFEIMANEETEFASLASIVDQEKERCGRFCISDHVNCMNEEGVIRIKPFESISVQDWQERRKQLLLQIQQARKGEGIYPIEIPLPIQRHSPLPELYRMVAFLKPRHLIANTSTPTARFISARMCENIGLVGANEAEERHKTMAGKTNTDIEEDRRKWKELQKAWQSAGNDDINYFQSESQTKPDAFFQRVSRFRTILFGQKKMESERLLLECLDAANDVLSNDLLPPASDSVLCPSSIEDKVPRKPSTSNKEKIWEVPGKYASINASPFMTAAMRQAGCCSTTSIERTQNALTNQSKSAELPILTTELASRYLAYAAMYLGWKIRNPSRYRQEMAWRAIRKIKPELAKQTEEALQKELGWAIPPWEDVTSISSNQPNNHEIDSPKQQSAPTPTTPCPMPNCTIAQSISPLELGKSAKILQNRLEREAESQQSLFSENLENDQIDAISEAQESIQLERLQSPPCAQRYERRYPKKHITLAQLRETIQNLRSGKSLPSFRSIGPACFDSIIEEWLNADKAYSSHQPVAYRRRRISVPMDSERMRCQLDLIGVAAKSQRARTLLGWESVDLIKAHYALRAMFEDRFNANTLAYTHESVIPHSKRAKIVLRYLEPHLD